MPVGGALDAVPIDPAILFDVGQPGHFRVFAVPVFQERVLAGRAEPAAERGDIRGLEFLAAEHKNGVFGEGALDPGKGRVIETGQIDPERLGPEGFAEWTQMR